MRSTLTRVDPAFICEVAAPPYVEGILNWLGNNETKSYLAPMVLPAAKSDFDSEVVLGCHAKLKKPPYRRGCQIFKRTN